MDPPVLTDNAHLSEEPQSIQGEPSRSNTGNPGPSVKKDPWDCFNLLTFDGGGVRGYWSLLAMKALMEMVAELELEEDSNVHDSFHPLEWQDGASRLPLTKAEESDAKQLASRDKYRALEPAKRFLPCHYFDYIGGTSTGALIAIMLGRFRMTVPDCLHEYEKLGAQIFGQPRTICELNLPGLVTRTKYDAKRLEEVFTEVTQQRREDVTDQLSMAKFPSRQGVCKTFVTTIACKPGGSVSETYLIRSYDYNERYPTTTAPTVDVPVRRNTWAREHEIRKAKQKPPVKRKINQGHAADMEIPQVARAATAAICYFDPVKIPREGDPISFEDGGFGAGNNPTQLGIEEIQGLHGQQRLGAVISVGTARSEAAETTENGIIDRIKTKLGKILNVATSPEIVHNDLVGRRDLVYFRINPELEKHRVRVPFDEWLPRNSKRKRITIFRRRGQEIAAGSETIEQIRRHFDSYLASPAAQRKFRECADELVGRRQARVKKDQAKWEQYAIGSQFLCKEPEEGNDCHKKFALRWELEAHLRDVHGFPQATIQKITNEQRSKTWFRYQQA